ncbi:hypothetical protein D9M69_560580 [compost metagenome]
MPPKTKSPHGRPWVGIQIKVEETHVGLITRHISPERHAALMFFRGSGIAEPTVHIAADPGGRLLRQPCDQERDAFIRGW